jgi:hypothetical protein
MKKGRLCLLTRSGGTQARSLLQQCEGLLAAVWMWFSLKTGSWVSRSLFHTGCGSVCNCFHSSGAKWRAMTSIIIPKTPYGVDLSQSIDLDASFHWGQIVTRLPCHWMSFVYKAHPRTGKGFSGPFSGSFLEYFSTSLLVQFHWVICTFVWLHWLLYSKH